MSPPPNMLRYRFKLLADEHRAGQSFYTKPSDPDLINKEGAGISRNK